MNEICTVILLALFPALGNFVGGLAAEWIDISKRTLNFALHASSGIILGIVSMEVMPEAIKGTPVWLLASMFMAGGCLYLLVGEGIKHMQRSRAKARAWMIYVAVAADLAGDGLLIGSGAAISNQLGFILAMGQVLADIPEGFAVTGNFRNKGISKRQRILASASFILIVVGVALLAYILLRDQDDIVKLSGLALVSGLYCLAAVEDMLKEAHETVEDTRWSSISFLGGFALFILISGYLG